MIKINDFKVSLRLYGLKAQSLLKQRASRGGGAVG